MLGMTNEEYLETKNKHLERQIAWLTGLSWITLPICLPVTIYSLLRAPLFSEVLKITEDWAKILTGLICLLIGAWINSAWERIKNKTV
jgi:hypothetical protein